jgi:hypothetical protein
MTQEEIQAEHLDGLHYGNPDPDCWICWQDGEPECPGT